ncbi:hypothetical protein B0T26DRAFT_300152 [Lasiosphaeria miniovina]|uniref:NACHT domain-containing protein n=1 Tax=Lasiosphaeria miniovina TaxID=1954250 RepID=A0AA40DYF8_9PEZI|nr:uncharacterized protein B0T26DRAFT_300152 [Lasiosphaeria miniovina]KAK0717606.1 hypothetical protein B0T26DRAFT_300152 [Lasiosphaeria miniovina]
MDAKSNKRRVTEESLAENRPSKRPTIAADTAQSFFDGHRFQNSGSGDIKVTGNVTIGAWTEKPGDCLHGLFVTDPLEDKNALKRKKGDRALGTCEWILRTEELTAWLGSGQTAGQESETTNVLWLHGNPGTGKSTIAIYLTEELSTAFSKTDKKTLAYFFCDSSFAARREATSVIKGLLYQLVKQHPQLLDYLLPKYNERGAELFKSFDALWTIFMAAAADQSTGRKYCIIDALDECDRESQNILLQQLERSFQSRDVSSNVRILVTSRPYSEIRECLEGFPNKDLASFSERQQDIDLFIKEKVADLAQRKKYTDKVKGQVSDILRDKAKGTFLWVGLACEELKGTASQRAIQILQSMPKELDSLYKKLLDTALNQDEVSRDDIRRILSCVAICSRPLTVLELSEACHLHQDEEDVETRVQFTREHIASCRLMVIIQDDKVLLLHQSVKDYVFRALADYFTDEREAHADLAYRCVDLLTDPDQSRNSFLDYATLNWPHHALMAQSTFKVGSRAEFFRIDSAIREQWLQHLRSKGLPYSEIPQQFSILHVAAQWGVSALVEYISHPDGQEHVDFVDGLGMTALEIAARSKYLDVVPALLGLGGKVTMPVVEAAAGNYMNGKEIITLLLDQRGDQITITEGVVKAAAGNYRNGEEVMALLLDRWGDQITITEEVVKAAARNDRNGKEVMALLLDRRGDQITITEEVVKAAAGYYGNGKEVMALLLDRRGDQITITEEVVKAAAGNYGNGKEVMALLLDRRGDQITITEEVVSMIAKRFDKEVMVLLLDRRGDQITITEEVVKAAAGNYGNGEEVMALLLDRRGDQITITEEVIL